MKSLAMCVITAIICVVCGVGLYKTYEPICIVFGVLSGMCFLGAVADTIESLTEKGGVMSDASIYLFDRVVYVPNFDGYDFDYDARPMYDSIERATREAVY